MGWSYDGHDFATVGAYVLTLVISYGSQAGLFGRTNAEISRDYPTPLTPAGFTFAIWGIIFTGQGISVAFLMYRPDQASMLWKQSVVKSVCIWWIVGWAAESLWQYLFQQRSKVSLVACAAVLIVAAFAFVSAMRNAHYLRPPLTDCSLTAIAKAIIVGSTTINAAWLTVAASVATLIAIKVTTSIDLRPLAIIAAVVVAIYGAQVVLQTKNFVYGLTLVWAFYGVASAQHHNRMIHNLSFVCMGVLGLLSIVTALQHASRRSSGAASPLLG